MDAYKESLRVSLKPEQLVYRYLLITQLLYCSLITSALLLLPWRWWVIVLMLPLLYCCIFYLIRNDWQRYYFLQQRKSIIGLRVSSSEQWFMLQADGVEVKLQITRLLLFGKTLVLLGEPFYESILSDVPPSGLLGRWSLFWHSILTYCQQVLDNFLYRRKRLLVISEITLTPSVFRQLLRRLYSSK